MSGRQHGHAASAMLAGNNPGFLEMIPGGFVDNNTLSSAHRAGVPDHVAGSGALDFGMNGLECHIWKQLIVFSSGRTTSRCLTSQ